MKCANCGVELLGSMKKCPKCGYDAETGMIDQAYMNRLAENRGTQKKSLVVVRDEDGRYALPGKKMVKAKIAVRDDGVLEIRIPHPHRRAAVQVAFGLLGRAVFDAIHEDDGADYPIEDIKLVKKSQSADSSGAWTFSMRDGTGFELRINKELESQLRDLLGDRWQDGNLSHPQTVLSSGKGRPGKQPFLVPVSYTKRRFIVNQDAVVLGTNANCAVVYPRDTAGISGRHCAVLWDPEREEFIVKDMNSSYGTFLENGRRLDPSRIYRLRPGERFYLGGQRLNEVLLNYGSFGTPEDLESRFNPEKNMVADVYGPPLWFGEGKTR
ncbi:MAG: FHA domain-containing protein [Oscillospiraceae bacterium]|nr:FHA domain-containing protein [Oscillospiraceae bacterium]